MFDAREARSREGEVLAGKYTLEERLGVGGMGEVYRATNTIAGRAVAIKMMLREHASDASLKARFLTEARAANMVRHPNVVDVIDVGEDERGVPFMVQELLEGEDLARHAQLRGGKIAPLEAVKLLLPVVDAVAYAHAKGVVHRDIKPENVFLARIGRETVPKLLDFGISRIADESSARLTATGVGLGTPAYMAPEQIRSARQTDARTDVWALGVLLFEVVAGDTPFPAESAAAMFVQIAVAEPTPLASLVPNAPPALERIIARCLRKNAAERYADAGELADALRALGDGKDDSFVLSLPASLEATKLPAAGALTDVESAVTMAPYDAPPIPITQPSAGVARFDDEAPSGLRLDSLPPMRGPAASSHEPRRQLALQPESTRAATPARARPHREAVPAAVNPATFAAPLVVGAVVVVVCGVLTVWSPLPDEVIRDGLKASGAPSAAFIAAAIFPSAIAIAILVRATRAFREGVAARRAAGLGLAVVASLFFVAAAVLLRAAT